MKLTQQDLDESLIDQIVQRRLSTDNAYRYAENAEAQIDREVEITRQVEREVEHRRTGYNPNKEI